MRQRKSPGDFFFADSVVLDCYSSPPSCAVACSQLLRTACGRWLLVRGGKIIVRLLRHLSVRHCLPLTPAMCFFVARHVLFVRAHICFLSISLPPISRLLCLGVCMYFVARVYVRALICSRHLHQDHVRLNGPCAQQVLHCKTFSCGQLL